MNMGFSGGFQIGECEPFGFCFLWPTVPISMNKLFSFFFLLGNLPTTVVNVFFHFQEV